MKQMTSARAYCAVLCLAVLAIAAIAACSLTAAAPAGDVITIPLPESDAAVQAGADQHQQSPVAPFGQRGFRRAVVVAVPAQIDQVAPAPRETVVVGVWVVINVTAWVRHWDPYPFILLNLMFSVQAAYAAPVIMMSQNRQAQRDRYQAQADYDTNVRAEREIEELQVQLRRIEETLGRIESAVSR